MRKKKNKLPKIAKVFFTLMALVLVFGISTGVLVFKNNILKIDKKALNEQIEVLKASLSNSENTIGQLYEMIDAQDGQISILEDKLATATSKSGYEARLTYYHLNDGTGSGDCTGSGKCIDDFQVNSKGWYTYKGKLVLAAATYECINSKGSGGCGKYNTVYKGKVYYNYWDEVVVTIDGVRYSGIILDSCGFCHKENATRVDLFVSNKKSGIDTNVKVY